MDATLATVRLAVAAKADLLLVHHGLFWGPAHPWTGKRQELIRCLIEHNLAVYSSHLPLDAHPRLGNNALLCDALGLKKLRPFFFDHGLFLGFQARATVPRADLVRRLQRATGAKPRLVPGGPQICRRIGVVSGGAGDELKKAADEGVDTFVTGEGPHWTYGLAEDLGLNVLYGGHYATETFGVKALAAHLSDEVQAALDLRGTSYGTVGPWKARRGSAGSSTDRWPLPCARAALLGHTHQHPFAVVGHHAQEAETFAERGHLRPGGEAFL